MTEQSLQTGKRTGEKGRGSHPNSLANLKATQFQKGRSGNPSGRPKDRLLPAIMAALKDEDVEAAARRFVEELVRGNLPYLKEYFDRVLGKPGQSIALGGPDGGPIRIRTVEVRLTDARDGADGDAPGSAPPGSIFEARESGW